jgi:hypothetical protein
VRPPDVCRCLPRNGPAGEDGRYGRDPRGCLAGRAILQEVGFLSLGTDDLARYTFAADRQVGALARLQDPWQPALLDLVAAPTDASNAEGKSCGMCGAAAADPLLACVLTGLAVTSLSRGAASLSYVRAEPARYTLVQCRRAAAAAPCPVRRNRSGRLPDAIDLPAHPLHRQPDRTPVPRRGPHDRRITGIARHAHPTHSARVRAGPRPCVERGRGPDLLDESSPVSEASVARARRTHQPIALSRRRPATANAPGQQPGSGARPPHQPDQRDHDGTHSPSAGTDRPWGHGRRGERLESAQDKNKKEWSA